MSDADRELVANKEKDKGNEVKNKIILLIQHPLKSHPLMVIPWLPLPRLYRNLGVIPSYTAVNEQRT